MRLQIDFFRRGELGFRSLVENLEGLLDAGEFDDRTFRREWYELWGSLEITRVTRGDDVTPSEVNTDLNALHSFLARALEDK